MAQPAMLSTERYKFWHLDFQRGIIRIVCQDGQILDDRLDSRMQVQNSQIATSTFDWEKWWILSTTTRDDLIITEGFNPDSAPPFNSRPSVYLDQNHWRTIADVLTEPGRVGNAAERQAAQELVQLATDGGVVLPLSMGHMLETAGLHTNRRYEVGIAMAGLAGGWQIRNPLDLWKHEVELAVRDFLGLMDGAPMLHPIVTEPGALFGRDTGLGITDGDPDVEKFMAMLTMPNVILDMLVHPAKTPKHPLDEWVEHHSRITSQVQAQDLQKVQRRHLARRRYWNENIGFYVDAYRRLSHSENFPTFSDRQLKRLLSGSPMVGLLSELFIRRFMDHQTKWRRNDLMDMFHLSSAAAYAAYVCAELHTGTQLRDAQRAMGRTETVFTTLVDVVGAIRRDGVRTESERAGQQLI